MKLPNYEQAVVPQAKIVEYLLSLNHEDGRSKARFFLSFGFRIEQWEVLASALLAHAANHEITKIESSPFGTRYVVEGIISAPDGRTAHIRAVWFIETDEERPRFVTAILYPGENHDSRIRSGCFNG
jgi:hypothetical protein